jgi:hypothetical protein
VREIAVDWVTLPDFPLTVTTEVPIVAPLVAVNFRVLVFIVGFGVSVAVTPLGRTEIDKLTEPVKPLAAFTATVLLALAPCFRVTLDGEALSVNVGGGLMTNVTEAVAPL